MPYGHFRFDSNFSSTNDALLHFSIAIKTPIEITLSDAGMAKPRKKIGPVDRQSAIHSFIDTYSTNTRQNNQKQVAEANDQAQ